MRIFWIDSHSSLNRTFKEELKIRDLNVIEKEVKALFNFESQDDDVFVIRLSNDCQSLVTLLKYLNAAKRNIRVIARVDRTALEMAIEAMDLGCLTVIAAEDVDQDGWVKRLDELAFVETYPSPKLKLIDDVKPVPKNEKAFVFVDPLSRKLLSLTERVAKTNVSVLLTGPTGSGKEVIARLLHESSNRASGPFVAVNCAAMPENLVEDMLFGHEKGSFTGASRAQAGLFEQAQNGTIFLDEIGDMSFNLQAKLLRILQERKVVRLGGQKVIDLDFRVVAATNCDLKRAIVERRFREDLYFRLTAFRLAVPELRCRPKDIMPLVAQFIQRNQSDSVIRRVSMCAQEKILSHSWPGNVRELENVISRALVLSQVGDIESEHIMFDELAISSENMVNKQSMSFFASPDDVSSNLQKNDKMLGNKITKSPIEAATAHDLSKTVRNTECEAIAAAINNSKNRKEAAARLGISPRTLRHKIQKLREEGISLSHAYAQ